MTYPGNFGYKEESHEEVLLIKNHVQEPGYYNPEDSEEESWHFDIEDIYQDLSSDTQIICAGSKREIKNKYFK